MTDDSEREVRSAFERGKFKSVATQAELAKFKAAAKATATTERRVNTRPSTRDDVRVAIERMFGA